MSDQVVGPLLVGVSTSYVAFIVTTLYLHRGLAHRAVDYIRPVEIVFRAILWLTTGIRRAQWVAVHRRHHARADTVDDPHGPGKYGYWQIQFLSILPYRRAARDSSIFPRHCRDVKGDRWDKLFDHGWVGVATGFSIAATVSSIEAAVLGAAAHILSYFVLQGLINALCHTRVQWRPTGYFRFYLEFEPTNRPLVAIITLGEGLHANHHRSQASARMSERRNELDLGWWLIASLQALGLAKSRRLPGFTRGEVTV